jgi:hypothetical protein
MICPHCSKPIKVKISKARPDLAGRPAMGKGWDVSRAQRFETSDPFNQSLGVSDFDGPMEATRMQPARAASIESDFLLPLAQSLATGILLSGCSIVAARALYPDWTWWLPANTFAITITGTWLHRLGLHTKLLWIIESVTQFGEDAPPEQPAAVVSLDVKHEEPSGRVGRMQFLNLPQGITEDQLLDWAQSVSSGVKSPARRNWTGNAGSFTHDGYNLFCKAMTEAGILRHQGNAGYTVTAGGKHALKHYIKDGK